MRRSLRALAAVVVAVLMFTTAAYASPIMYQLAGTASGTIGTTAFTDQTVAFTGIGDTANVTLLGGLIYANPFTEFTVAINGIGMATITDPGEIWSIPTPSPGFSPVPVVVFGRVDAPPALASITGVGILGSPALAGYLGTTSLGPINDLGGIGFPACGGPGQEPCLGTSLGLLSFSANFSVPPTGIATFDATLEPVPEPASLFLVGSGVLALAGRYRSRARKR